MHPKEFVSRHTAHGRKYEGTTAFEYQKFINARKTLVAVLKCGCVVSKETPVFVPLMGRLLILVVVCHVVF